MFMDGPQFYLEISQLGSIQLSRHLDVKLDKNIFTLGKGLLNFVHENHENLNDGVMIIFGVVIFGHETNTNQI